MGIESGLSYRWRGAPVITLLLADRRDAECVRKLHSLGERCPLVPNPHWLEGLAGRDIPAVTPTLPLETAGAAKRRNRARDLQAKVEELLVELRE